jgi:hypothetical protein
VLDHQGFADHLDVDRHPSTVIRRRCVGRDVSGGQQRWYSASGRLKRQSEMSMR